MVAIIVFIAVDRLVFKTWKVGLFDSVQAFIRSIGKLEIFAATAGSILVVFYCMNYHYGQDYFFKFEWLNEKSLDTISARNDGTPS